MILCAQLNAMPTEILKNIHKRQLHTLACILSPYKAHTCLCHAHFSQAHIHT